MGDRAVLIVKAWNKLTWGFIHRHLGVILRYLFQGVRYISIYVAEAVQMPHNAVLVTKMPIATIALLCKQTSDNFRTHPPPERPTTPSIGKPVIICSSFPHDIQQ